MKEGTKDDKERQGNERWQDKEGMKERGKEMIDKGEKQKE